MKKYFKFEDLYIGLKCNITADGYYPYGEIVSINKKKKTFRFKYEHIINKNIITRESKCAFVFED